MFHTMFLPETHRIPVLVERAKKTWSKKIRAAHRQGAGERSMGPGRRLHRRRRHRRQRARMGAHGGCARRSARNRELPRAHRSATGVRRSLRDLTDTCCVARGATRLARARGGTARGGDRPSRRRARANTCTCVRPDRQAAGTRGAPVARRGRERSVLMTTENAAVLPPATPGVEPEKAGRLSWGGLIGGLLVALAVWIALTVLGLAVNLSAIDPSNPAASLRGIGISAGIWSLVVWILALFAGGAVAGHAAGILERPRGAIHGVVLWSLATVLGIFLVAGVLRTVVRGHARGGRVGGGGRRRGRRGGRPAPRARRRLGDRAAQRPARQRRQAPESRRQRSRSRSAT